MKAQAGYFRHLKESLLAKTEAKALMDYTENYSFICQDAIQGFHWEIEQIRHDPFTIYYRDEDEGDLKFF